MFPHIKWEGEEYEKWSMKPQQREGAVVAIRSVEKSTWAEMTEERRDVKTAFFGKGGGGDVIYLDAVSLYFGAVAVQSLTTEEWIVGEQF